MTLPSQRRFAGVLAHHNGEVLLVRERHVRWGGELWNVPSGMVEAHETPAQGAARELSEEEGSVVSFLSLRACRRLFLRARHAHALPDGRAS